MTIDFVCKHLAKLLDSPCNFSPPDEIMFKSEKCKSDCGQISDSECWKRYFQTVAEMESE